MAPPTACLSPIGEDLLQRGLDVRLGWAQAMHDGRFRGRQPESLTREEWQEVILPAILR